MVVLMYRRNEIDERYPNLQNKTDQEILCYIQHTMHPEDIVVLAIHIL